MAGGRIAVEVEGQRLSLSNLDKVLYPEVEFTKRDVIDYYSRVAPYLLPHLRNRATTFVRYPDGVTAASFFEKDVSRHAPAWIRTADLEDDSEVNAYPVIDDLASLVWAANLAALELHVPQWTVGKGNTRRAPDRLVFDLDPGAPATVVECCRVAERLREMLTADGLEVFAKTSGSKGLQLYCGVRTRQPDGTSRYAKALAERLAKETPDLVVARMMKSLRPGKVFIDWSQNNQAKTTIAPYSLRGREEPTVSTPIGWDEVEDCRKPRDLVFTSDDVLARVEEFGDLFEELPETRGTLPRA